MNRSISERRQQAVFTMMLNLLSNYYLLFSRVRAMFSTDVENGIHNFSIVRVNSMAAVPVFVHGEKTWQVRTFIVNVSEYAAMAGNRSCVCFIKARLHDSPARHRLHHGYTTIRTRDVRRFRC